jgi:hypothetical protein
MKFSVVPKRRRRRLKPQARSSASRVQVRPFPLTLTRIYGWHRSAGMLPPIQSAVGWGINLRGQHKLPIELLVLLAVEVLDGS